MKSQIYEAEHVFYFGLLSALYSDVAGAFPARIQTECRRDLDRIQARIQMEGLSFLTKTLPSLGRAIDKALASDTVLQVPAFAKKRGSKLPRFLGWLIGLVFSSTGEALPAKEQACLALRAIRSICFCFYKLQMPLDPKLSDKVIATFIENEFKMDSFPSLSVQDKTIVRTARKLIGRILCDTDPRVIIPKHGPGAVSTGQKNWEKPDFTRIIPRLDAVYPFDTHFCFSPSHLCDMLEKNELDGIETYGGEMTSKVVLVPKDSRGPRLISMEPVEFQWIQQGLKQVLVDTLESHVLTSGRINFRNQLVNRDLAQSSSQDGSKVTLDMKDASDMVSLALVQMLFPENWVECMESCRSTSTETPDGRVISLNKFAPMGSALCFPVEALVFWSLAVSALMHHRRCTLRQAAAGVFVYGDDIITDKKDYLVVMSALTAVGLRFNDHKCCVGAHFRESCGLDAYNGVNVTPLRVKQRWCHRSLPVQTHATWVAFSNAAYERGLYNLAHFVENEVQQLAKTPYTGSTPTAIQFVRPDMVTVQLNRSRNVRMRFNKQLHRLEAFSRSVCPVQVQSKTGWNELLAHTTRSGFWSRQGPSDPLKGPSGLQAGLYSAPHRVTSKCGWAQVS